MSSVVRHLYGESYSIRSSLSPLLWLLPSGRHFPAGRCIARSAVLSGLVLGWSVSGSSLHAQTAEQAVPVSTIALGGAESAGGAGGAWGREVLRLARYDVREKRQTYAEVAEDELGGVPGGTSVVRPDWFERGRVANVADALRFQPGVLAQSANGGEATRLSIRGSGLTRAPFLFGWGTQVLLDGLPLYSTSGVPYETIEPLVVSNIQVLRGANGFDFGPTSLGGVINYVTRTGYDAAPFQARVEAGSFGYRRAQVSSGQVLGEFDYYVSGTRFEQDGFRNRSGAYSSRLVFNAGYKLTSRIATRFNFRFARQIQEDAGSLTWAQLQANPRQSQFPDVRIRENPRTYLLSNNTTVQIDDRSTLELGVQYHNYPIVSVGGPAPNRFPFEDLSGALRYTRRDLVGGNRPSTTFVGLYGYDQIYTRFDTFDAKGSPTGRRPSDQTEWTLVVSNDLPLARGLSLTSGLAGIYQARESGITFSAAPIVGPTAIEHTYRNLAPRIGARYELTPNTSVFANVSRSIDTPSANSLVRTNAQLIPVSVIDLKAQKATTTEIGTRGEHGIFQWNVSLYHSWIDDELLTVQIAPGSPPATVTSNATPTHHQGIEAELDTTLWQRKHSERKSTERLSLRQSYTLNDFYYDGDPLYGRNQLPAVPRHVYQAEVSYEHPSGWYAGLNLDAVLSRYAVDFANTFYAKPSTVWGGRLGYAPTGKGWELFVEARNVTDRKYAPVVSSSFNAAGNDVAVFSPGQARNFATGVSIRL